MKCLVVLLMVTNILADDVWKPQTKTEMLYSHVKCMERFSGSNLMLATVDFWNLPENIPDIEMVSIRGYIHCLLSSLGYFDDKQGYNVDRIMIQFNEIPYLKNRALHRSVFEKCADNNENKDAPEVWAFRGFRCLMNEVKKESAGEYKKILT